MKPYYEESGITLYLGDNRVILPRLESASVCAFVTDPPYVGLKGGVKHSLGGVAKRNQATETVAEPWGNDLTALAECKRIATAGAIVFCSWQRIGDIPPIVGGESVGLLTWYKRNSPLPVRNRPHYQTEHAWLISFGGDGINWKRIRTCYDIPGLVAGCMATERFVDATGAAVHKTQKPVALMTPIVSACTGAICDPYAGTGTTLLAAKQSGLRAIGIEQNERYCEMAANRLKQGVLFGAA